MGLGIRKFFPLCTHPRDVSTCKNYTPSSNASVQRLFFMGKDVLHPKRCQMSIKHFEMLLFLCASKN